MSGGASWHQGLHSWYFFVSRLAYSSHHNTHIDRSRLRKCEGDFYARLQQVDKAGCCREYVAAARHLPLTGTYLSCPEGGRSPDCRQTRLGWRVIEAGRHTPRGRPPHVHWAPLACCHLQIFAIQSMCQTGTDLDITLSINMYVSRCVCRASTMCIDLHPHPDLCFSHHLLHVQSMPTNCVEIMAAVSFREPLAFVQVNCCNISLFYIEGTHTDVLLSCEFCDALQ
mgnify:CR=1 FL=1